MIVNYLSIKDSAATPDSVFYAYLSVDAGNNTGWNIFPYAEPDNLFGGVAHFRKLHERSLKRQEELENLINEPTITKSDTVTEIKLPKVYKKTARPVVVNNNVVIDSAKLKSEIRDELIKQYMISLQVQKDNDEAMFMMMLMLS